MSIVAAKQEKETGKEAREEEVLAKKAAGEATEETAPTLATNEEQEAVEEAPTVTAKEREKVAEGAKAEKAAKEELRNGKTLPDAVKMGTKRREGDDTTHRTVDEGRAKSHWPHRRDATNAAPKETGCTVKQAPTKVPALAMAKTSVPASLPTDPLKICTLCVKAHKVGDAQPARNFERHVTQRDMYPAARCSKVLWKNNVRQGRGQPRSRSSVNNVDS